MKKLIIYIFLLFAFSSRLFSQTVVTVGNGGPDYLNLKEAFDDINAGNITGNIVLQITDNCTQFGTAVLFPTFYLGNSDYTSVTIYPVGSGYTVSGNVNGPLIDLSGATNVTFDGRVNQSGPPDLIITNQNTGASASTIKFSESANNNLLHYCIIKGAETGASSGVIFFSTSSSGSGNDANTLDNNFITADAAGRPVNAIFSAGTSGSENSGNTINNNNIYNFFNPGISSNGIFLSSSTTAWTITGNSFYETVSFVPAAAVIYNVLQINNTSGTGYNVSGNFIGGNSALSGGSAWTKTNGSNNTFYGINMNVGSGTASSVQNNTISNINWSNSSNAMWTGINVAGGDVNIGTATANTIGATTGTGSVTITGGATNTIVYGINIPGAGTVNCQNNNVGSVTAGNSNPANATNLYGINKTSSAGITNISNNHIGSTTTANSLSVSSASTGNSQSLIGISYAGTASGTITGNSIANLFNNTTLASGVIAGMNFNGTAGADNVTGNIISGLTTGNSPNNASVYGLRIQSGSTTYANNIITLGGNTQTIIYGIYENGTAGNDNNVYFNSVYIGGTPSSGNKNSYALFNNASTNTRNFINNILYNARSNSGATGKHYAAFINVSGGSIACDYNDYYVTGTGGVLGYYGADHTVLPVVTGQDTHSFATNPLFANAGGTSPSDYIPAETTLAGVSGTPVVTDYNGAARSSTPTMGALETGVCTNPTNGGTIASSQSGCNPFNPLAFTSTSPASGFIGSTLEYKWQQSIAGSGSGFTDIPTSNATTYDAGSLTQTTWFKRLARVTCKSDWTGAAESNVLIVTVNPLPIAGAITGGSEVCMGGSLSLTANATGTPLLTYTWLSSNRAVATVDNSGNITPVSAGSTNITYKVTDGSSTGCQATSPIHLVTVNALPLATPITGGNALCKNSTMTLIPHATGTPMLTYTWNSTNTTVATVNNSGVVTAVSTGSTLIRYSVTDGSGTACSAISSPYTVTVNPLPVAGVITGVNALCMGSTLPLTSNATGTPALTFTWASSNTAVATVNNSGTVTPVSAGATNITYTVTDGSLTLCSATSPTFAITVYGPPQINLTVGGSGTICSGTGTNITVALSEAGVNYQLRNATGNIIIGAPVAGTGGTISMPTGNLASTTTFNILATIGVTNCQAQLNQTVTITIDPSSSTGTLESGTGPVTFGNSTGDITLSGYIGSIVKWQKMVGTGTWDDIMNTTASYNEIPISVGTWEYRALVQSGTCPSAFSSAFSITVSPKPLSISAGNQVKNYGQAFSFNGTEFIVTGLINGDAVTSVTLTSAGAALTADVSGSPYPITTGGAVGTGLGNYTINYINGSFTVSKAQLSVTADALSKVYGTANQALTFSYSGFQNGENESVIDSKPLAGTTINNNTPAGIYPGAIIVSGGSDNNYSYIYVVGTFTVKKSPQTITFSDFPEKLLAGDSYTLVATSTSGLTVLFQSEDITKATVEGEVLTGVSGGNVEIKAYRPGDQNFDPAEVSSTIEITSTHRDIMHLFTPNNDGFNDYWEIPDLATWGKSDVKVFSRWGKLVFSDSDYNNRWDGTSDGNPLPEGAYYFIIKTENAGIVKGALNLVR